jgi:hypothetical protein
MKTIAQNLILLAAVASAIDFSNTPALAQATADQTKPAAQATSRDNPDARYAQILGQLMRVRLERIRELNSQVAGTITADDVSVIELELKAADQLQQQATNSKEIDWFSMVLTQAQISKTSADMDWKRVAKLRQQSPQTLSELDAEMVHLRAQLADMNLERGKAAQNKSADDRQNWALQYLVMEVQTLQDKVQRLEERE